MTRLQYRSLPLRCGLPKAAIPYTDVLKGWGIEEEWTPTEKTERNVSLVDYQISLNREVARHENRNKQEEELLQLQEEAFLLINNLKLLWPLIFLSLQSLPRTMTATNAPECWASNSSEVLNSFHQMEVWTTMTVREHSWVILPYAPLDKIVTAYKAYESASPPLRTLVELYHDALQSDGQAAMFTLAKALELVRAILPARTDQAKMKQLPPEALSDITRDLSWLFTIANNRYEIRHVVKDITGPHLHQQITFDEKKDFIQNASRIIRATICQAFGIPFVHVHNTQRHEFGNPRSL